MKRFLVAAALGLTLVVSGGSALVGCGASQILPQSTSAQIFEARRTRNNVGEALNESYKAGLITKEQHAELFGLLILASDVIDEAEAAALADDEATAEAKLAEADRQIGEVRSGVKR